MDIKGTSYNNLLSQFCISGINYRKSDTGTRGKFSLSAEQSDSLLQKASQKNISGCIALSTCNRTEIYGISNDPMAFAKLIAENTGNDLQQFLQQSYFYNGMEAIEHLFKVASGLDSQIIGDYEILSQLKQAAKNSKEMGLLNGFMERAVNYALQVSKEIKTKTKLSTGTVSVSYAAIEIIKEKIADISGKKILLVGTGKFGNHVARNFKDYLPEANIFFTNRTNEKAVELSENYNGKYIPYIDLPQSSNEADVIIVSSASSSYSILPEYFTNNKSRLILDLSVPQNVHPEVKNIEGITVLNVDEVSSILEKTISARKAEIPKALEIINQTLGSLEEWHRNQFNNPLLKMVKEQLYELNNNYFDIPLDEEKIHKSVSSLALKLKVKNNKGCLCINTLSNYLHETIT